VWLTDVGLVLEGGGMRAMYTAGVLEYFLEKGIEFPYVIGVSAGSAVAASYLSKQKGRNYKVNIHFVTDPRYLSLRNFFKKRQLFGMDFIFGEIPNKLVPFDYKTFWDNPAELAVGVTDCYTGEPVYFKKADYKPDLLTVLKASSTLPFIAPEVHFKGRVFMDGGISDSIPIRKAQADGYRKNVVILTRNKGYRKKPSPLLGLLKRKYPEYTGLHKAMANRHKMYNETLEYLEEEEKKGNVLIIRPAIPLEVGRIEKDQRKLNALYYQGYEDGKRYAAEIMAEVNV